jgi:hypothetical protein
MAFLDGEADPDTKLHLQQCKHCRDRAKTLEREQKLLTSQLYRASCPSTDELGEFHLRMLPSDQMLIISQHVRECPLCTREIDQLKEFLSGLGPAPEGNLMQRTKRMVAQLVSGGGATGIAGEPSLALRGESDTPLTFEVSGILIVIDIQEAVDGKLNIFGQVAAEQQDDWTAALVKLNQKDQPEITTTVDDLGAFQLKGILPGSVDLQIVAKDSTEIVIPTFESSD